MKLFLLDNHDSFTYNLASVFRSYEGVSLSIHTPENTNISELSEYDKIIFSPGPGIPSETTFMGKIIKLYSKTHSILGVCLGHQAIGVYFGADVKNLKEVNHGKLKKLKILNRRIKIFDEIPDNSSIGLYHSWVLDRNNFPDCLEIIAECNHSEIMAIRHKSYDITGLQFHPESFITEYGEKMLFNWLYK